MLVDAADVSDGGSVGNMPKSSELVDCAVLACALVLGGDTGAKRALTRMLEI